MPNPFLQRASEYQRNETEFLATLTPSLFRMTLDRYSDPVELLTKTVVLSAPPGSGKTTMARFFQYSTLTRLLEQANRTPDPTYEELVDFASERGFVRDGSVKICGARISMERDYRELALIGYSQQRAHELFLSLLGARAVLAWRQAFVDVGISPDAITVIPTPSGRARLEHLGGTSLAALALRANEVESLIYGLTASFIPPLEEDLVRTLGGQYYSLLAIEAFQVPGESDPLQAFLMIDDAHWADRAQHQMLMEHLTLREVTMGRWILQRMEALDPRDALIWGDPEVAIATDGIQRKRTVVDIRTSQSTDDMRGAVRRNFRRAAGEIASRYMMQIPDLARHGITSLSGLEIKTRSTQSVIDDVQSIPRKIAEKLEIPTAQVEQIRQKVYEFVGKKTDFEAETIAPAMVGILLHRQFRRAPQRSLFDNNTDETLIEDVVVEADGDVAAGAQVHLWHGYKVPYLGGLDTVADLGTENVETFLHLAWQLVRLLETQVVRRGDKAPTLTVKQQHEALTKEGQRIVNEWSFPHAVAVRKLAQGIAQMCVRRSLEDSAPLGGGATALGIERGAFAKVVEHEKLMEALRFGVGYNAFSLIPGRKTKGKVWTLLELSGPIIAAYGLTSRRGGFIPTDLDTLIGMLGEVPS
jgi:hypothetical protein